MTKYVDIGKFSREELTDALSYVASDLLFGWFCFSSVWLNRNTKPKNTSKKWESRGTADLAREGCSVQAMGQPDINAILSIMSLDGTCYESTPMLIEVQEIMGSLSSHFERSRSRERVRGWNYQILIVSNQQCSHAVAGSGMSRIQPHYMSCWPR